MAAPLFLVGFMAAGKSSVGRALAAHTGRRFVDLDDTIDVADAGSVAALVSRDEAEFRRREAEALRLAIMRATDGPIISTGGGAVGHAGNLDTMRHVGCVVALGVDVDVAIARASRDGSVRPLLADAAKLAAVRAPIYRRAHAVVDTTNKSIDEVAREVAAVERIFARTGGDPIVALGERSYAVKVTTDFANIAPGPRDVVITDSNVAAYHQIPGSRTIAIEPGEATKSFDTYHQLCEELVARGLDRESTIYALGGGVVGDLAGFVAATLYRGIPVVQLPTTIVAMTDAAIGGKTAIDLPAGKNLVGAFHQPRLVHANLLTLPTLPERERRAGFGELWKYALLDGPELWRAVEACAEWAASDGPAQAPAALREVIRRCAAYKAAIVGRDEREQSGHRLLLNLGHTIGHAIEAARGLLHGEAVGLGLVAAARVSAALGLCPPTLEPQIAGALYRTGLPADPTPYLDEPTLARVGVDKKRLGDRVSFVAIREVGACEPVPITITELRRILRPNPAA